MKNLSNEKSEYVEILPVKTGRTEQVARKLVLFLGIAAAAACQHTPTVVEFPETALPSEELESLDKDMQLSLNNQVDVLSPKSFPQATNALNLAREKYQKNQSSKKVLYEIAKGKAFLKRANEVATVSRDKVGEIIQARGSAIKAKAMVYFPAEFRKAELNLKELTSKFEDNNFQIAENKRDLLLNSYLDLELEAIKHRFLGPSREKISTALREDAKTFAPRSLVATENKIHQTDVFITTNRHDFQKIKRLSDEALASSEHLLKIISESKALGRKPSESLALDLESKSEAVENEKNSVADLSVQAEKLKEKEQFNALFENARRNFLTSEADVFRRGNILVIRLHSLHFPISQAVLVGKNFAVLGKVKNVVEELKPVQVTIEGHTDSTGGRNINYRVSHARASAIADYLVETNAIERTRVQAVGLGEDKPVASNKTKEGRSKNRRVDIEIMPRQDF